MRTLPILMNAFANMIGMYIPIQIHREQYIPYAIVHVSQFAVCDRCSPPCFFVFLNTELPLNLGSVFHFGYGLGVMNQLGGDLEKIFDEQGTTVAMNFTSG